MCCPWAAGILDISKLYFSFLLIFVKNRIVSAGSPVLHVLCLDGSPREGWASPLVLLSRLDLLMLRFGHRRTVSDVETDMQTDLQTDTTAGCLHIQLYTTAILYCVYYTPLYTAAMSYSSSTTAPLYPPQLQHHCTTVSPTPPIL